MMRAPQHARSGRRAGPAWLAAAFLSLLLCGLGGTACAQQQRDGAAAPPAYVQQVLPQARLAGQGLFTWWGLAIYQARLWVGPAGYVAAAPAAAPFVLDLRYARALEGRKIAEASADQMEKIGAGSAVQRQAWLQKMLAIFPDVKEGSHIAGAYLPALGARFYLDGKLLADVPDPDFARAFFAIWLDPASTGKELRAALLADAGPRP